MLKNKNGFNQNAIEIQDSQEHLKEISALVFDAIKSLGASYFDLVSHLKADTKDFGLIIEAVGFLLDSLKNDKRYSLLCDKIDSAKQHLEILTQTIDMIDFSWQDLCSRIGVPEFKANLNNNIIDDKIYVQPASVENQFAEDSEQRLSDKKTLSQDEALSAIDEFRRSIREVKKVMPVATSRYIFFLGQYFDLKLLRRLWLEKKDLQASGEAVASCEDLQSCKSDCSDTDSSGNVDKVCSSANVDGRISV